MNWKTILKRVLRSKNMKRFDKRYVYSHLLTDFFSSLVLTFLLCEELLFDSETEEFIAGRVAILSCVALFVVIYSCLAVYRVLYYRTSGYALTEREIQCQRGVLFRRNSVVEYTKIHALNKKQTIFHKIFGIAVLTVDSGSTSTAHQAEITVVEKNAVVDALLNKLHVLREGGGRVGGDAVEQTVLLTERDSLYRFTSKKKLLYTLISIVSTALFTVVFGAALGIVLGICHWLLQLNFVSTMGEYAAFAVSIVLGVTALCSVISFVGCIIRSFVGYHNFSITKRDNDIEIAYGLLERHTNTFSYDRIKGVKITQGLVQRLLGFATVKLEVIGYVNETGSDSVELGVLVPFCRYREVGEILSKVLPDYVPQEKQTTAVAFLPFVSWFLLIFGSITALVAAVILVDMHLLGATAAVAAVVLCVILGAGLILCLIVFSNAYLNYKTSGLAWDDHKITAYSGGFTKTVTVFKGRNLVAVEDVTTPLRKKAGIASLVLHLRTNALSNEVKVPIQRDSLAHELDKQLIL